MFVQFGGFLGVDAIGRVRSRRATICPKVNLIDIFYVDKVKLKKYDTSAKLDALADVGLKYAAISDFEEISWEEALKRKAAG